MEKNGIPVTILRPVGYDIAYGVYPNMMGQGWAKQIPGHRIPTRTTGKIFRYRHLPRSHV